MRRKSLNDQMVASVERATALGGRANERERGHLAAVQAWIRAEFPPVRTASNPAAPAL